MLPDGVLTEASEMVREAEKGWAPAFHMLHPTDVCMAFIAAIKTQVRAGKLNQSDFDAVIHEASATAAKLDTERKRHTVVN